MLSCRPCLVLDGNPAWFATKIWQTETALELIDSRVQWREAIVDQTSPRNRDRNRFPVHVSYLQTRTIYKEIIERLQHEISEGV